jgi:cell division protein ZapA (FtsZ GTPase activity inhibitor)
MVNDELLMVNEKGTLFATRTEQRNRSKQKTLRQAQGKKLEKRN